MPPPPTGASTRRSPPRRRPIGSARAGGVRARAGAGRGYRRPVGDRITSRTLARRGDAEHDAPDDDLDGFGRGEGPGRGQEEVLPGPPKRRGGRGGHVRPPERLEPERLEEVIGQGAGVRLEDGWGQGCGAQAARRAPVRRDEGGGRHAGAAGQGAGGRAGPPACDRPARAGAQAVGCGDVEPSAEPRGPAGQGGQGRGGRVRGRRALPRPPAPGAPRGASDLPRAGAVAARRGGVARRGDGARRRPVRRGVGRGRDGHGGSRARSGAVRPGARRGRGDRGGPRQDRVGPLRHLRALRRAHPQGEARGPALRAPVHRLQERGPVAPLSSRLARPGAGASWRRTLTVFAVAAAVVGPLSLALAYNSGIAFSLGTGLGGPILVLVGLLVLGLVASARLVTSRAGAVALGLVLGGALGNLVDRLARAGAVVDFIRTTFWPTFNLADAAIVCGCAALVVRSLRRPAARRGRARARDEGTAQR